MRLLHTNATVKIKRRTTSSGNKKQDVDIQSGLTAFISDAGTTADHEQSYVIMLNREDVTSTINVDTDTLEDSEGNNYKAENVEKKTYHYAVRSIKCV